MDTLAGIVTQGRADYPQWAQTFWISVSLDEKEWTWIEGKRIFPGQTDQAPYTQNPKPRTLRPKPQTPNPNAQTPNPKP